MMKKVLKIRANNGLITVTERWLTAVRRLVLGQMVRAVSAA
jgi:hypothetical protein